MGNKNRTTIRTQRSNTVNPITENWESLPGCRQWHRLTYTHTHTKPCTVGDTIPDKNRRFLS